MLRLVRFIHRLLRPLEVEPLHTRCLPAGPAFEISAVGLPVADSGHTLELRPSAATVSALDSWLFDWLTGDYHFYLPIGFCRYPRPLKTAVSTHPALTAAG